MSREWTEEDEERYQLDREKWQLERIRKIRDKAEKRYNELEANYNDTGSSSTYRSMKYYEDLLNICDMARKSVEGVCSRCESHRRAADVFIKKYQEAKASDLTDILTFDNVIADFTSCKYL